MSTSPTTTVDLEKQAASSRHSVAKSSSDFSSLKEGDIDDNAAALIQGNGLERYMAPLGKGQTLIQWDGDMDPENPKNFSLAYKRYLTGLTAMLVLNSTFTSSSPTGIVRGMRMTFGFDEEMAILTISVFVIGYCVGPVLWGPLSEKIGRRPVFLVALLAYTGFNIGCALAPTSNALIAFRFLAGAFAASPLTTAGGVVADIWEAKERGNAISIFSIAPFAGPAFGPIVGGAITVAGIDWRWLYWICAIFSGVCFVVTALTLKETLAAVILVNKAKRIRKETKDDRYVAPMELLRLGLKDKLSIVLGRPLSMLVKEPILAALTLYISFVYGVIFLLFEAYPVVFMGLHGFDELQNGLCFLPYFGGCCAAVITYVIFINPHYIRKVEASEDGAVPPEERLYTAMLAGPILIAGFFWFAWTSFPYVSYWLPLMAGFMLGFGFLFCFLGIINYIMDVYLQLAASALAANTICRSVAGAAFPLFSEQMYKAMRPEWASSLLGFIALLLMPLPFIFYKYGPQIRSLSKYAKV